MGLIEERYMMFHSFSGRRGFYIHNFTWLIQANHASINVSFISEEKYFVCTVAPHLMHIYILPPFSFVGNKFLVVLHVQP